MAVCPSVSEPDARLPSLANNDILRPSAPTFPQDTTGETWLALPAGEFYYRASCQAAKELPNPVHFWKADDAEEHGLRRSQVPGC